MHNWWQTYFLRSETRYHFAFCAIFKNILCSFHTQMHFDIGSKQISSAHCEFQQLFPIQYMAFRHYSHPQRLPYSCLPNISSLPFAPLHVSLLIRFLCFFFSVASLFRRFLFTIFFRLIFQLSDSCHKFQDALVNTSIATEWLQKIDEMKYQKQMLQNCLLVFRWALVHIIVAFKKDSVIPKRS